MNINMKLDIKQSAAILGFHVFTGCHHSGQFSGKTKLSCRKHSPQHMKKYLNNYHAYRYPIYYQMMSGIVLGYICKGKSNEQSK